MYLKSTLGSIGEDKKMSETRKGRYPLEVEAVHVNIPAVIVDAVRKHAGPLGFNMSTFWRKYIIEGYKKQSEEERWGL